MSRLIKAFGYVEKFGDTVVCNADTLSELDLVGFHFVISKDYKEESILVPTWVVAPEDYTGFITLHAELKDRFSVELPVPEGEFVDALFDTLMNYDGQAWKQKDINVWLRQLGKKLAQQAIDNGYWILSSDKKWYNNLDDLYATNV